MVVSSWRRGFQPAVVTAVASIRRRQSLCFFELHLALAALESAGTGFVAEHFGSAFFAHVTLAQCVGHCTDSSKNLSNCSVLANPVSDLKYDHESRNGRFATCATISFSAGC